MFVSATLYHYGIRNFVAVHYLRLPAASFTSIESVSVNVHSRANIHTVTTSVNCYAMLLVPQDTLDEQLFRAVLFCQPLNNLYRRSPIPFLLGVYDLIEILKSPML